MAIPSNYPMQGYADGVLSRIYTSGEVMDGALQYSGTTTNATATELFLAKGDTEGLLDNSVPEVTENSRLWVPPSTMLFGEIVVMGLRTDIAAHAVHHLSRWAFSVFRPTTGNLATSGTNAFGTAGNPAQSIVITGTAGHSALAVNTAGYLTLTVTGALNQTIQWRATVDKLRSLGE